MEKKMILVEAQGFSGYRQAAKQHDMHVEHFETWANDQITEAYTQSLKEQEITPEQIVLALGRDSFTIFGYETKKIHTHHQAENAALNKADELGLGTEQAYIEITEITER